MHDCMEEQLCNSVAVKLLFGRPLIYDHVPTRLGEKFVGDFQHI
jgi:hypothetical protein